MGKVSQGVPETPLSASTPWWKRDWFFGLLLVIGSLTFVAVFVFFFGSDEEAENTASTGQNQADVSANQVDTPTLTQQHEVGDVLRVPATYWTCEVLPDLPGRCLTQLHVHQGDFVQVRGEPEILGKSEKYPAGFWFWPVIVLRGGVYVEGLDFYISDSDQLYGPFPELPSRRKPDFEIGEELLVGYNFILRASPNGEPLHIDEYGRTDLAYGRDRVTLMSEPVLGNDGHYWCEVQGQYVELGWIPCEFQRIE
ncbi:MAG: hypothetical protein Q8P13_02295 [bacterium]|nr:hypothetical protein [bacterium]